MKNNMRETIWDFFVITAATLMVSVGVYFFMMPSDVSIGSVAALAMVITEFVPISVATLTMMINVVLLVLAFIFMGKEFGVKTVYAAILMPGVMWVFEQVFPNNVSFTGDQLLDVLCYCILVSLAQALLFGRNASSGGLDIVAKFLNKYLHMDLGKAVGLAGMGVAVSSALVCDKKTVVLAVLGTYLNGIVVDQFIFGNTIKRRVCILSQKEDEILHFILHELHSGATKYHAYGTYSDVCRTEINTIVDKNEYQKLMEFIRKNDPDAFVTVYAVSEMMYKPKIIAREDK